MFFMETTIVLEENGPQHWKLPVTREEMSLLTDSGYFSPIQTMSLYSSETSKSTVPTPSKPLLNSSPLSSKLMTRSSTIFRYHSTFRSPEPTFLPFVTPTTTPVSLDSENTKVILGSILGGVLGFAIVAISIFCLLSCFSDRHKIMGRRRKRRRCQFICHKDRKRGRLAAKNKYRKFPGEIEKGSSDSDDQETNPLDYVHIPVNSIVQPYERSPFHSKDLLRFKPIDPNNAAIQQQRRDPVTIPTIIKYPVTPEQDPARSSNESKPDTNIHTPQFMRTRKISPQLTLQHSSSRNSVSSSNYSPQSNHGISSWPNSPLYPLIENLIDEAGESNSFIGFRVPTGGSHDANKLRSPLNLDRPRLPAYANASHRQQLLNNFKPRKGIKRTLYDDGHGKYPEFEFGEAIEMPDLKIPKIPPQASPQRRKITLKKIQELSWSKTVAKTADKKDIPKGMISGNSTNNAPTKYTNGVPSRVPKVSSSVEIRSPNSGSIKVPVRVPSYPAQASNDSASHSFGGFPDIITGGFPNHIPSSDFTYIPDFKVSKAPLSITGIIPNHTSSGSQRGIPGDISSHTMTRDPLVVASNNSKNKEFMTTDVPSIDSSPKNDELYDDYIIFSNAYISREHKNENATYV